MSSIYGSVDYGTELRAAKVAALEYIAPYGVPEITFTEAPEDILADAESEGWEWPTDERDTILGAIGDAVEELKEVS